MLSAGRMKPHEDGWRIPPKGVVLAARRQGPEGTKNRSDGSGDRFVGVFMRLRGRITQDPREHVNRARR
jgi:hypothetical protein